jgi:U3 small nucleolar ribonucleoprotein component
MKNRILKFDDFKKGTPEQKPAQQVKVAGGMPKTTKEKPFDQVKRAKLAHLDKSEPDYSKVRKLDESSADDIAKVDSQMADLDKQIAQIQSKKADLIKQKAIYTASAATADSTTTTTTLAPVPVAPTAPGVVAQPGTALPVK